VLEHPGKSGKEDKVKGAWSRRKKVFKSCVRKSKMRWAVGKKKGEAAGHVSRGKSKLTSGELAPRRF